MPTLAPSVTPSPTGERACPCAVTVLRNCAERRTAGSSGRTGRASSTRRLLRTLASRSRSPRRARLLLPPRDRRVAHVAPSWHRTAAPRSSENSQRLIELLGIELERASRTRSPRAIGSPVSKSAHAERTWASARAPRGASCELGVEQGRSDRDRDARKSPARKLLRARAKSCARRGGGQGTSANASAEISTASSPHFTSVIAAGLDRDASAAQWTLPFVTSSMAARACASSSRSSSNGIDSEWRASSCARRAAVVRRRSRMHLVSWASQLVNRPPPACNCSRIESPSAWPYWMGCTVIAATGVLHLT